MPTFQVPNASSSTNQLPTQQRFMSQAGYVNPTMTVNYQSSASLVPMNANNGHMQAGFQNQAPAAQSMNLT